MMYIFAKVDAVYRMQFLDLKKNNKQTKLTNIRNGRCLTYAFPPEVGRSFAEACNHAG